MRKIAKDYYAELAVFLMDYHGGQTSRGYRLLCRLGPKNFSSIFCEQMRETECYQYLAANYAETV